MAQRRQKHATDMMDAHLREQGRQNEVRKARDERNRRADQQEAQAAEYAEARLRRYNNVPLQNAAADRVEFKTMIAILKKRAEAGGEESTSGQPEAQVHETS